MIRRRKRKIATTQSHHWLRKWPNLIKDKLPVRPNEIWVSDITYWKINKDKHLYISFVTDAYSKKIVGHYVADNLDATGCVQALKMAIKGLKVKPNSSMELCHHSDRGLQYCSSAYVKLLQDNNIGISMTESGDPRDNAIAERVNGIIKEEYLSVYEVSSELEAKTLLNDVVQLYNNDRPHMSISNMTPAFVHQNRVSVARLWKNYYPQKEKIVNQIQD